MRVDGCGKCLFREHLSHESGQLVAEFIRIGLEGRVELLRNSDGYFRIEFRKELRSILKLRVVGGFVFI